MSDVLETKENEDSTAIMDTLPPTILSRPASAFAEKEIMFMLVFKTGIYREFR